MLYYLKIQVFLLEKNNILLVKNISSELTTTFKDGGVKIPFVLLIIKLEFTWILLKFLKAAESNCINILDGIFSRLSSGFKGGVTNYFLVQSKSNEKINFLFFKWKLLAVDYFNYVVVRNLSISDTYAFQGGGVWLLKNLSNFI